MRSQAVIEFNLDGTIITANDNFLAALGYQLSEIQGKHHRIFVDPEEANSPEYKQFWTDLAHGQFQSAAYRRIAKGGREVWIQATYNPVFDKRGKPIKVIKFATDITQQKNQSADHEAQIAAISRAQAVIEFGLDGTIRNANENFLATLGYSLDEITGRHHRMFVDPTHASSAEYRQFWERLRSGEYVAGEFQRVGKNGQPIWIQASYNPVLDAQGRPVKVVKFATDITERKRAEGIIAQLSSSLAKMAEGDLSGRIDTEFTGEYEQLRQAFNRSLSRLLDIVSSLRSTSRSLKNATGEILAGANDLSERTTKQAATIEETSASVEQLSSAVHANADRAATASQKAKAVATSATEGGSVMSQANTAMDAIESSSAKISNIIGLIDDIAFQTNLLALNASVEAARAGDAGKGFAVVAVEVRRLAQSAAQASSEVKVLIEASASEVKAGSRLVGQVASKLKDIVTGAQESSALIDSIAQANSEQSSSLGEVSVAVRLMDEMTQHNAALVEETNAAIEQTEAQASELDHIVEIFKLDEKMPLSPPARSAPPVQSSVSRYKPALRTVGNAAVSEDWNEF
ncbi:MAG: methyl-accepting chemotaxis protein [Candidatus Devosia phytovorans]|uniref:Methyl-accepting chemotaxis protein n=1 Tax=Candidatus Devosia phytovorans TaxID=3121372 RepID=A0AAJ5VV17_9HYPH|nr:methyl-accepting chemotaxis protein [Devosia sp.]WEK04440.1 MAG: methyl-accepting chemotaxis protein [Devosia sp.]